MIRFDRRQLGGLALGAGALAGTAAARALLRRRVRDRTVLITGGSRGLGLVLARQLARKGARLVLCARNAPELELAQAELRRRGAEVRTFVCDVTDRDAVEDMVEQATAASGAIDVLVNVAGIIQVGPAEAMTEADFQAAMDANFWGLVYATFAVLPQMRARRRGTVVNITSIGGDVAVPHLLPYTASKYAAVGFSEGLRAEASKDGVTVVTVLPGLMRTGSFLHALVKGRRAAETGWFALASSMPLITVGADRAARRIVRAMERGEPFVTVGLPAKALRVFHALWPGVAARVFAAVNRALPDAPETLIGPAMPAELHRPRIARPPFTVLGDRAAARNNETPPLSPPA